MKLIIVILILVSIGSCLFLSREKRAEMMDRVDGAARALNGTEERAVPKVVAEQRRKEQIRQNNTWTAENQALHPIEYCQAQIEEVGKLSQKLQVQLHKLTTTKSATKRQIEDAEGQLKSVTAFLAAAKAEYRKADATNQWPMTVNGFRLSQSLAKERIVEAANKLPILQQNIATMKGNLGRIDTKIDANGVEQRKLIAVRERLQAAITDIKTKQVVDGEKGINDALNAINDSLSSLNPDVSEPTLSELIVPDKSAARDAAFDAIMAEP